MFNFHYIANYIHWRFVKDLGSYTTTQMRDLAFAFSKVLYGTSQPEARSNTCANQANNLLGFAVGAKYVERAFDEDAKTEVEMQRRNTFDSVYDVRVIFRPSS